PSVVTLSPPIELLANAGLVRDARALVPKTGGDDESRCATFTQIEAGYDAYLIGQKLPVSKPLETAPWVWTCAYPRPYDDVVAALEKREHLPRGLMHAILRQESGFRVEVVSPAGAVGIAQLMPFTAAATAKQAGTTLDETDVAALQAPFLQLDLSARHLHALFIELGAPLGSEDDPDKVARVVPLVFAAYNAGAGAVKRWLGEAGTMDADVFIERIPFIETRGYTARVLGNLVRYAIFAGERPPVMPAKLQ
ncbi:MAG: lytic transglycosylase domain-containing protein, partial [Polyangiales bacterium]